MKRFVVACCSALVVLSPVGAAEKQTFSESTSVVAVEVPVQVVLDGKPVRGLTQENFEIVQGRSREEITGFEVIDLQVAASAPAQQEAISVASRRHFLFFFDLAFSEPEALVRARAAAREMVQTDLHPTDLVAVATYSLAKGPNLVLGFTPDRRQAEVAIDTLGSPELLDRNPDPLRLALSDFQAGGTMRPSGSGGASGARAEVDAAMLENLQHLANVSEAASIQNQAARITGMTRSFSDLARLMATVRGRKYVVYLSQGFDSKLLVGNEEGDSAEVRSSIESGAIWDVNSEARFGSTKTQGDLEKMLEEFRRADCVIQSVDISGVRAAGDQRARASGEAGLLLMAKDTGGDLYKNFNDLGQAMTQMLDRTSVTYVLAFQPDVKFDGAYHRIEVKLKNAPRGARVVHRPGFYAPKPFAQRAGLERQLQAADALFNAEDSGALDAAVLAAPFRPVGTAKAYVPVLVEVGGPSLLQGHSGNALAAEVYVYAFDSSGSVRDFVVQSVGLDLTKAPPPLKQTGFKFFGHLDLEPGDYTVRSFIRNGQTGISALRVERISVPAAGAEPRLLQPLFPEQLGKWMIIREAQAAGEPQAAYPFMMGEAPYVPAARPRLVPGGAQVALVGYNLGTASEYAIDFQSMEGKSVARVPLQSVQKLKSEPGTDRLSASLDVKGIAAGFYTVQLIASAGGAAVTSPPLLVEVAGN